MKLLGGPAQKPLIVLDGQNIAMRHGRDRVFSTRGLQLAINYWQKNGHKVVCFLPDYLFDYSQVAAKKKIQEMKLNKVNAAQVPDDMPLLHKLLKLDCIVRTPSQDYDDSYCI